MRILLSNDDGYYAPPMALLAAELGAMAQVTVVAPERDRSGASNSLTLDRPLTVRRAASGFYYVNGTPTDCVHVALTGLLDEAPDLVVSGINDGANMGEDTLYSGTVAAAMEGFLLGIPAIAVSLAAKGGAHFRAAARVTVELVERMRRQPPEAAWLLNVNVPDAAYEGLQGIAVTRLGRRHKSEPVTASVNPRGETVYWIGAAGPARDDGEGTDFHAVASGRISITPLHVDLTRTAHLESVAGWLR